MEIISVRLLVLGGVEQSLGASMLLRVLAPTIEVSHRNKEFAVAQDGQVVVEGDRAKIGPAGQGLITFFDGSTLALDPNTVVALGKAEIRDGGVFLSLTQTAGRTWSNVQKFTNPNSRYEIRTPAATAAVRGTGFQVVVLPDGTTRVRVSDGVVAISAQGVEVQVPPGSETAALPGQAPAAPTPWTAGRLRVALRAPAGVALVAVVDPRNRACGSLDSQALGVQAPNPLDVKQVPLCTMIPPSGGVTTIEVADPGAGPYTIVLFARAEGGSYSLDVSGVLGGSTSFTAGTSGSIPGDEILAAQLTVVVAPDGTLSSSGPLSAVRVAAVKTAAGIPFATAPLAIVTVANDPPVALVPLGTGAARPPRAAPPLPGWLGLAATLGFGTLGAAFLGFVLLGGRIQPLLTVLGITMSVGLVAGTLSLLLFYRDWLVRLYYSIANALR